MYDPLDLSRAVASVVCREGKRKYYRFRATRFYGGSATADTVGCNLRCVYCWNWRINANPERFGTFYSPEDVVQRLITIVKEKGFSYVRVTGGEPTLCFPHLLRLIELIPPRYTFILETNGILLADEDRVRALSSFEHLFVRVSLKGVDGETFHRVTGADPRFFDFQIRALELLSRFGVPARPALPFNLFPPDKIRALQRRLIEIDDAYVLELEPVLDYGGAYKRLRAAGLDIYWP